MLDLREALDLVAPHLEAIARQEKMAVVVTEATRVKDGWLLYFNTAKFVETGDMMDGLLGNIPIEVGDDGKLRPRQTPS